MLLLFQSLIGLSIEDDLANRLRQLEISLGEQRRENEERLRRESELEISLREQRRENEERLQQLMDEIQELKSARPPPPGELNRIPPQ